MVETERRPAVLSTATNPEVHQQLLQHTRGRVVVIVARVVAQRTDELGEHAPVRAEGVERGEDAIGGVRLDIVVAQTTPNAQTPGEAQGAGPLDLELWEGVPERLLVPRIPGDILVAEAAVVIGEILLLVNQFDLKPLAGPKFG